MPLDPFAALSLAGNILQFIDFSNKVLNKGRKLYKSTDGVLPVNKELDLVVADLETLMGKLCKPSHLASLKGRSTESENALETICEACGNVANEIHMHLKALRVEGTHRKWQSFRQAIKTAWTADDLQALLRRLGAFQDNLQMHVLVGLRDNMNSVSIQLSDRFNSVDENTRIIIRSLLEDRDRITQVSKDLQHQSIALARLLQRIESITDELHSFDKSSEKREAEGVERFVGLPGVRFTRKDSFHEIGEKKQLWEEELEIRSSIDQNILDSLRFKSMSARCEAIPEAYAKTFEWIFQEPAAQNPVRSWSSFNKWLLNGSGVYWLSGKAASGKSTLMRYIYESKETHRLLALSAHPAQISTCIFYFWSSGTLEQRSQSGLLRSLLFGMLNRHRKLIPVALPSYWASAYTELVDSRLQGEPPKLLKQSWNLSTLMIAFRNLVQQDIVQIKMCFFVDGLDEFEGNYEEIAGLFKSITSPRVKVCLSGRPLLVFEDAFGLSPKLRLQDLTRQDIRRFVNEKLELHPRFRLLMDDRPRDARDLIMEVVTKADGVFLWVSLVVESLLKGLGNRDEIEDLRKRVQLLPRDLEALYGHMLSRIDPVYLVQASQIFQIMGGLRIMSDLDRESGKAADMDPDEEHSSELDERPQPEDFAPLTLLGLWFARGEDCDLVYREGVILMSEDELLRRRDAMAAQLKSRCAGLIESDDSWKKGSFRSIDPSGRIRYLHRTVRDFFDKDEPWHMLLSHTAKTDFNPYTAYLTSCIVQLRCMISDTSGKSSSKIAKIAMTCAAYADGSHGSYSTLVDQLDLVMTRRKCFKGMNHWSSFTDQLSLVSLWQNSILSSSVQYGLLQYTKNELGNGKNVYQLKTGRPLLHYAVSDAGTVDDRRCINSKMVDLLLRHGSDPNSRFQNLSAWQATLTTIENYHLESGSNPRIPARRILELIEICQLMLRHGADPNSCCFFGVDYKPKSAWCIITNAFQNTAPAETIKLQKLLVQRGGKEHGIIDGVTRSPRVWKIWSS